MMNFNGFFRKFRLTGNSTMDKGPKRRASEPGAGERRSGRAWLRKRGGVMR
mgnify:CR=1 FL=1